MPTSLLTDKYELTMLAAFLSDGTAHHPATFEAFARHLPDGRRFGITAGLGRLLPQIRDFTFPHDTLRWLHDQKVIPSHALRHLENFRFTGDIWAYPEGEVYWPGSPVLRVEGTVAECAVLETLVLSVLNHDSAVASAAARMAITARGRTLIEMGSRRVHEQAAIAAARAAYVGGFTSTSNLQAARTWGIPATGTAAHVFTLAHASEEAAFRSQVRTHGPDTTLLVDTYDIEQGIRTAVRVVREELGGAVRGPGAIRLDSGDLAAESTRARALLYSLGAYTTQIVVSSDLDEYLIENLHTCPIDTYGVGTRVATGSGHPTAGMVYKIVAVADTPDGPMRPASKTSPGKASTGGRKTPYRHPNGAEGFTLDGTAPPHTQPVQERVMTHGEITTDLSLETARNRATQTLRDLNPIARQITDGDPFTCCEDTTQR